MKSKRFRKFLVAVASLGAISLTLASCGVKGEQGNQGERGSDGRSVVSIEKTSSNGNVDTYTITYSDGTTSTFTVTNGKDGAQGIQGDRGEDGNTPVITIGENGNWFIDGVDSGIAAKGMKGDKGEQGSSLLTGNGEPSNDIGKDGDSYIDTDTFDFYVKSNGVWVKKGNITGNDAVSIVNTYIDEDGHLICEMSDGTKKDVGKVKDTSKHTVNFYYCNNLLDTVEVMDGGKVSAPSEDKIRGYQVYYWYTSENEGRDSYYNVPWSFSGNTVTCDLDLHLNGHPFVYYITYNFIDGAKNSNRPAYTVLDSFFFDDPSKDGYTFGGWYTEASFENKITGIQEGSIGDITVYAKWSADIQELSVASEEISKGTAEIVSGQGYTDEKITVKATPAEGYVFKGWYENGKRVSAYETYTFTMPARGVSLTAEFWTEEEKAEKAEKAAALGITPTFNAESNTVTYGLYPQAHVSDEDLISSLNELTDVESNGWYLYDGSYYAKKAANPYESDYKFGDKTTIVKGAEYWFKCEPIEWKILSSSDGTYSLVSSLLLDAHCYNSSSSDRTIDGETVYANNYEHSDIRTWLNSDFYDSAFALDGSLIQAVTVDNSAATTNSSINICACNDTQDKVYLLSYQDYKNADYFADSSSRRCKPTDWAKANGAYVYTGSNYYGDGCYWTRSPYSLDSYIAWVVDDYGNLMLGDVSHSNSCVRPSLQINVA